MKKLVWGILYTIFGVLWTAATLSAVFADDFDTVVGIIIFVLFTIPGIFIIYNGIRRIINHKRTKADEISDFLEKKDNPEFIKNEDIPTFSREDLLINWVIKGREWERFKERKCTPEAMSRAASLYSVFLGIGAGAVILLFFAGYPTNVMLSAGSIAALFTAAGAFYFIRKAEYNKYGFAYSLNQGELTITNEYANFCGKIIPLNLRNNEFLKGQIFEKNGFSYLFLRVWKRSFGRYTIELYEFPIPDDKLQEARKIF